MRLAMCDICGSKETIKNQLDRIWSEGEWFDVCVTCQEENNGPARLKQARKELLAAFGDKMEQLI